MSVVVIIYPSLDSRAQGTTYLLLIAPCSRFALMAHSELQSIYPAPLPANNSGTLHSTPTALEATVSVTYNDVALRLHYKPLSVTSKSAASLLLEKVRAESPVRSTIW